MIPQCEPQRPARRRRLGLLGAFVLVVLAAMVPSVAADGITSDDVAAEIVRVQLRADELAEQWTQTQVESDQLADDLAAAQTQLDASEAQYRLLEDQLTDIALRRFTGDAPGTLPFFGDPGDALEQGVLQGVALDSGAADLDEVDAVRSQLADDRLAVERLTEQNDQLADRLQQDQVELEDQLVQLDELHTQLVDAEVRAAYERQLAEQRQRIADQQAAAAAEAAATAVVSGTQTVAAPRGGGQTPTPAAPTATPGPVATTPSAGAPAADAPVTPQAPAAAAPASPSGDEPVDQPADTDPAPAATDPAPATTQPAPAPAPVAPVVVKSGFQCPVAGSVAFGDTWGAARSGGRSHEGVDMMAALGTPVVAVVSGSVQMKTTNLGGNSAWVTGNDGNKYFYAHLNGWEGSSRSVSAGEVIGYVGHTGNTTANHLHFEIHPGGGAAINPYPTVRQYC